jgi:hypothetical protein
MIARTGLLALAAATAALSGCDRFFGDMNAHDPGTPLGSFTVSADATSNTCGAGALGEQATWSFDVELNRAPGALYWNNGATVIPGTVAGDGVTFSFETSVIEDMRDPNVTGPPPCSIARADAASGTLDSATDTVTSFTGTLSYTFTPTAGSSCDDLTQGSAAIVAALPCGFSYAMSGAR